MLRGRKTGSSPAVGRLVKRRPPAQSHLREAVTLSAGGPVTCPYVRSHPSFARLRRTPTHPPVCPFDCQSGAATSGWMAAAAWRDLLGVCRGGGASRRLQDGEDKHPQPEVTCHASRGRQTRRFFLSARRFFLSASGVEEPSLLRSQTVQPRQLRGRRRHVMAIRTLRGARLLQA